MSTETEKNTQVAKMRISPAKRFTEKVLRELPVNEEQKQNLSAFQRKIIDNYFVGIDLALKNAESRRYGNSYPEYSWENINWDKLGIKVASYSEIGLDPMQDNHISFIPYWNKKLSLYDMNFTPGYNGLELKARKFGYDVPDDVIFELKYSTDKFKSIKRNFNNKIESYDFEITNDFDRGELEGGFYYMIYTDNPEKNKLVVMNRHQIEKRRPDNASPEFWGGEKDEWKNGQKTGNKVEVEGWEEEMFLKTLKRHCWNSINIDSQKINDNLMKVIETESQAVDRDIKNQITEGSNRRTIDIDDDTDFEEVEETSQEDSDEENQRLIDEAMAEEATKEAATAGPNF